MAESRDAATVVRWARQSLAAAPYVFALVIEALGFAILTGTSHSDPSVVARIAPRWNASHSTSWLDQIFASIYRLLGTWAVYVHLPLWWPCVLASLSSIMLLNFIRRVRQGARLLEEDSLLMEVRRRVIHSAGVLALIFGGIGFALKLSPGGFRVRFAPVVIVAIAVWWSDRLFNRSVSSFGLAFGQKPGLRTRINPVWRHQLKFALKFDDVQPYFSIDITIDGEARSHDYYIEYFLHRDAKTSAYIFARQLDGLLKKGNLPSVERAIARWVDSGRIKSSSALTNVIAEFKRRVGLEGSQYETTQRWPLRPFRIVTATLTTRGLRNLQLRILLELDAKRSGTKNLSELGTLLHVFPVVQTSPKLDLDDLYWTLVFHARGIQLVAEACASLGRHERASEYYLDAADIFHEARDRFGFADCLVKSVKNACYALIPDTESVHALLGRMYAALTVLEDVRRELRGTQLRSAFIHRYHAIYQTVLDLCFAWAPLSEGDACAELAFWVVESLKRSALEEIIQSSGSDVIDGVTALVADDQLDTERQAGIDDIFAAFLRNTDVVVPQLLKADASDVLLCYHVWREERAWQIRAVGLSAGRPLMHSAEVPINTEVTWLHDPGQVLDRLSTGNPVDVGWIFRGLRMDQQVWHALSRAILPVALQESLDSAYFPRPLKLTVVPSGPLGQIPFPGLTLENGSQLISFADICLSPSLSARRHHGPPGQRRRAAIYLASNHAEGAIDVISETAAWQRVSSDVALIEVSDKQQFHQQLSMANIDMLYAASHGEGGLTTWFNSLSLDGGVKFDAVEALSMPWPDSVVFGACWLGDVRLTVGVEPTGFPIACLMGGATTVLGAMGPLNDQTGGQIMSGLIHKWAAGQDVNAALWASVREFLADDPSQRLAPPSAWSVLASWSTSANVSALSETLQDAVVFSSWKSDGTWDGATEPSIRIGEHTFDPRAALRQLERIHKPLLSQAALATLQSSARPWASTIELLRAATRYGEGSPGDWSRFELGLNYSHLADLTSTSEAASAKFWYRSGPATTSIYLSRHAATALLIAFEAAHQEDADYVMPRHLVYGSLAVPDGLAWMQVSSAGISRNDVDELYSQTLFPAGVPDAQQVPTISNTEELNGLPTLPDGNSGFTRLATQFEGLGPFPFKIAGMASLLLIAIGSYASYLHHLDDRYFGKIIVGIYYQNVRLINGRSAVEVTGVLHGKCAQQAGILPGDIVLSIDSTQIFRAADMKRLIESHHRGEVLQFEIARSGTLKELAVRICDAY